MFFSIIIPTYNRAHLILDTLNSIQNQDFIDFELIVVDDGSTDNTKEVVENYISNNKLKNWYYFYKKNGERGLARNFGTIHAKGKYINWFDSDDIALENHLEDSSRFCLELDYPEVFHMAYRLNDFRVKNVKDVSNFEKINNSNLIFGNNLSCNGVFVRRDIALKNQFNEDRRLSASEDYELWIRLASKYKIYCSNIITSVISLHDGRSVYNMNDSNTLINRFESFLKYVDSNVDSVKFIGKNYDYFIMKNYLLLAVDLVSHGNKKKAIKFLFMGCSKSIFFIKEKTFYAIIKHLIFK